MGTYCGIVSIISNTTCQVFRVKVLRGRLGAETRAHRQTRASLQAAEEHAALRIAGVKRQLTLMADAVVAVADVLNH